MEVLLRHNRFRISMLLLVLYKAPKLVTVVLGDNPLTVARHVDLSRRHAHATLSLVLPTVY